MLITWNSPRGMLPERGSLNVRGANDSMEVGYQALHCADAVNISAMLTKICAKVSTYTYGVPNHVTVYLCYMPTPQA